MPSAESAGNAAYNPAFDFDGNGVINTADTGSCRGSVWAGIPVVELLVAGCQVLTVYRSHRIAPQAIATSSTMAVMITQGAWSRVEV